MGNHLVELIAAAMQEQVEATGTYDHMQVAEDVFASIKPEDYAETLRLIIFQWVARVGTPATVTD